MTTKSDLSYVIREAQREALKETRDYLRDYLAQPDVNAYDYTLGVCAALEKINAQLDALDTEEERERTAAYEKVLAEERADKAKRIFTENLLAETEESE